MATRIKRCVAIGDCDAQAGAPIKQQPTTRAAEADEKTAETRMVKLRQNSDQNAKLGFSLRGGKEATGSSVGVFVSHVESCGEAHRKGLKLGDQLVRVNGLDVDRATYDEVIAIIKRAPRCGSDILLEVRGGNLIPFQEKCGQPIKWLQVTRDDVACSASMDASSHCSSSSSSSSSALSAVSISTSDEGVDSCESNDSAHLSPPRSWTREKRRDHQQHRKQETISNNKTQSAGSSTLSSSSSSVDGGCCSISISSLTSSGDCDATYGQDSELQPDEPPELEVEIRVPSQQQHHHHQVAESFGCGVVKGPDEWPGIFVQNVRAGSLAEQVGLEAGDQLLEADGTQLNELAFETAIGLIKQLQRKQTELVLLVRKGAALRHLARQSASSSSSRTPSSSSTLTSTLTAGSAAATQGATWSASDCVVAGKTKTKTKEPLTAASGATREQRQPPIKPRVSLKWSTAGDANDDEQQQQQAAVAGRNPISSGGGTQNQPTKRITSAATKDNNNNEPANAGADATTRLSSSNWMASSELERLGFEQQEADASRATTKSSAREMDSAPAFKSADCLGCNSMTRDQRRLRRESDEDDNDEEDEDEDEDEDDDVERIRIVSQNCQLHHRRRIAATATTTAAPISVVVREKFPQLAVSQLDRHQTIQKQPTNSTGQRMANSTSSSASSGGGACNSRTNLLKKANRYVQQQRAEQRTSGMQRYVSMDNLCLQSQPAFQSRAAVLCGQPPAHRPPSTGSHYYASPKLADSAAVERFAQIQQQHQQYRRRSNSVLGQPLFSITGDCQLDVGCCDKYQQHQPRSVIDRLQPATDCCSLSSADRARRIHWPVATNFGSQTLAIAATQSSGSCRQLARRLHLRAQSVDKLNQRQHIIDAAAPAVTLNPRQDNYLRRFVDRRTSAQSAAAAATGSKRRLIQSQQQRCPATNCQQCQISFSCQRSTLASAPISYNASNRQQMISHQSSSSSSSSSCCRQPARGSRCLQLTRKTSISHLNLQEESIYLTSDCCPVQQQTTCCCGYQQQAPRVALMGAHRVAGGASRQAQARAAAPKSSSTGADSSGYISSSGSLCAHPASHAARHNRQQRNSRTTKQQRSESLAATAAPLQRPPPPPPPMITMELAARATQQQQQLQQRDTRVQCLSTFVSGGQRGSSATTIAASSSAESDFSSFSPNNSLTSSSANSSLVPLPGCPAPVPTRTNPTSESDTLRHSAATTMAPTPTAVSLSPPRPPPLPMPDPDFECRINTLKLQQQTSGSKGNLKTAAAMSTPLSGGGENESTSVLVKTKKTTKQQLDRLCFVDELKMLAQQQQKSSAAASETSATLIKTLKASKQQASSCSSCHCVGQQARTKTGACRLHDRQQQQPASKRATPNDKLNEEDNKRRQHEMLMKEFKSAHSRMFNKRRQVNAPDESLLDDGVASSSGSEKAQQAAAAVNSRNYSPRTELLPANVAAAKSTAPVANNNGPKKGSISAVSSVQIATAN